jgi:hypothetical protein
MTFLECLKSFCAAFAFRKGNRDVSSVPPSDIGLVAFRRSGVDGWEIRAIQQTYDATVAEIRSELGPDVEVHRISGGRDAQTPGSYELGWMRDGGTGCWRAPGELITQPRTPSTQVRDVSVTFAPPDAGWIVLGIAAGDQTTEISVSYIYDPFPDLVAVLENLSNGIGGRVTIDTEGAYCDLHCYALEPDDLVRLIVTREPSHTSDPEQDLLVDVTTDRAGFVQSVYSSMVRYFTSDAYLQNKRQWSSDDPDFGFDAEDFSTFRSGVLDTLIGSADGAA